MSALTNNKLVVYLRGAKEELEKVTWPTRKEVLIYSAIVIVVSLIWGAYFGALDFLLSTGLEQVIQ